MSAKSLIVRDLSKNYGGVTALRDVNVTVQAGEVHGIIGPNGAGKSTLVDIISGFTPASSGTIALSGDQMARRPYELARAGVARTFQHTSLFQEETVGGNLEIAAACLQRPFGRRWRGAPSGEISEVLKIVNLGSQIDAPADSLSYGAQRRLAIAIALMSQPDVLLLDEPAAGMNPVESREFVELVRSIRADRTIVLIEHDMTVIRALCDRSTVLVDGNVLTAGPTSDVLEDEQVIDVYLGVAHE
jgi:branched-chain amino acid transport system ATP-binding protein